MHAVFDLKQTKHEKADKIAIFGAGPTGLIHMILAKHYGASQIILVDINEFRLKFAKNIDSDIQHNKLEKQ